MAKKNKKNAARSNAAHMPAQSGLPIDEMLKRLTPENTEKLKTMLAQSARGYKFNGLSTDLTARRTRIVNIANEDVGGYIRKVLNQHPNISQEQLSEIYTKQFREYNDALVTRKLALSREEVQRLDTIDLRAVGQKTANVHDMPELDITDTMSEKMTEYIKDRTSGFYRVLPCFSKGALRMNQERYIYFEVRHIDMETKQYDVMLRDYAFIHMSDGNLWQPGIYGTVTVTNDENADEYEIRAAEDDCFLFYEIYRQISPTSMGWGRIQKTAWKEIAIANAKATAERLKNMDTNNVIQLARLFLRYVTLSNFILESNKPKIAPGQDDKLEHNKSISNKSKTSHKKSPNGQEKQNPNPEDIPEKIVRNVGLIKIVSTRTPRVFSSKSIRNYKIPSWTARGHTRHYKSGKTVYIQPTVHHRKAMKNPDGKIPQSVINIVNNTKTPDTPE